MKPWPHHWLHRLAIGGLAGGITLQAWQGWWLFAAIQAAILAVVAFAYGVTCGREQGRLIGYRLGRLQGMHDALRDRGQHLN